METESQRWNISRITLHVTNPVWLWGTQSNLLAFCQILKSILKGWKLSFYNQSLKIKRADIFLFIFFTLSMWYSKAQINKNWFNDWGAQQPCFLLLMQLELNLRHKLKDKGLRLTLSWLQTSKLSWGWNFHHVRNPGISKLEHTIEISVLSLLTSTQVCGHTWFWPNFVFKDIFFHQETKIFPLYH